MDELIYIADDEQNIRDVVKSFLESEGYRVRAFEDGGQLLQAFHDQPCDLIILDIMMPGLSGFEVCREIRKENTVPIIMLTARDSDIDYATGINLGSDDYFTKPFSAMSLVMRVKAILRRIDYERQEQPKQGIEKLVYTDIEINRQYKTVTVGGATVDLTPNEYNLLCYLVESKERAVSREELLNNIWGYTCEVETRAADDTVRRLRKKLASSEVSIETVWGFGFRLKGQVADE
jgi:DNA-binding response OmpR family regulator